MTGRNGILSLSIDDVQVLHSAYMPFLINGGLFISAHGQYQIGSEIFLILRLLADPEKIAISTKVVWVTPTRALGVNNGGIGLQFRDRDCIAQARIENLLQGQVGQELGSQTL